VGENPLDGTGHAAAFAGASID